MFDLQDVLQKLLKDPVIQECRLREDVDMEDMSVAGDGLLHSQMTSKQALQVGWCVFVYMCVCVCV